MTTLTQSDLRRTLQEADFRFPKEARIDLEHSTKAEVIVDFRTVMKINSEELNGLIRFRSEIARTGRSLVLRNVADHLMRLFLVTRLDRLMEVHRASKVAI